MPSHEEIRAAVYGEVFKSATTQLELLQQSLQQQYNIGFDSYESVAKWAHDHHLDILAYGKAQHQFYFVTQYGELLTRRAWLEYYCKDLLFIWREEDGKRKAVPWVPTGHAYYDRARIVGETTDGNRLPLHHRDYVTPTGFFDDTRGTFNVAKPFPVFARETGRDTSHIYTFIKHIAGECTPWLLAWLRAKMCYPTEKTQVVPIIVSRAQGSGKTTFAEVICKGLFGEDNVLVTDQYDSQARFNADYADALIVCQEEKDEVDRRNPTGSLKSRATATKIRKENKGIDPIYQDSFTDFMMTSNKDVPIKFDDRTEQRRFMVMGADEDFTRNKSVLADEVFTKLYGKDADMNSVGLPFTEDRDLIAQFKHELFTNEEIANTPLRRFPKTAAYYKCFTMPRTNENVEIENTMRALAPFIVAALKREAITPQITYSETGEVLDLSHFINSPQALQYVPRMGDQPPFVAICRPLVFYDNSTGKPYAHSTVERGIYDCEPWLMEDFGLHIIPDMSPLPGGFKNVNNSRRVGAAARITLATELPQPDLITQNATAILELRDVAIESARLGTRLRVNGKWQPDPDGAYETVNELRPGVTTLENKNQSVAYMDTFLFEADETTKHIYMMEDSRVQFAVTQGMVLQAERLFAERLRLQLAEATRLYKEGIAARVVYSGGKSYHIIVRIKDAPTSLQEYKWLHAHLCMVLSDKVVFDASTSDPARLTRAPIERERSFEYHDCPVRGTQKLIYENWLNVYDYDWQSHYQEWLNRPLTDYEQTTGKRLMPMRPEYRDAMYALLNGTFWTDPTWNGQRQRCFFPAYRLCRILGYSHDSLWSEDGILDGLDSYYRRDEISYWRQREKSALILQIDKDVDAREEEERNGA